MTTYAIYIDGSETATAYAQGRKDRDKVVTFWTNAGHTATWKALKD